MKCLNSITKINEALADACKTIPPAVYKTLSIQNGETLRTYAVPYDTDIKDVVELIAHATSTGASISIKTTTGMVSIGNAVLQNSIITIS